jgi:hypothetical protein
METIRLRRLAGNRLWQRGNCSDLRHPVDARGFSAGTNAIFSNTNSEGFPTTGNRSLSIISREMYQTAIPTPVGRSWGVGDPDHVEPGAEYRYRFRSVVRSSKYGFVGTVVLGGLGTVFQANAITRSSGLNNIDNQDVYSVMFRIQRNFLYYPAVASAMADPGPWQRGRGCFRLCERCGGSIADVNRTLRGWFEYFKHSHHKTFRTEGGFVRRRLRSILRRQTHRKGSARGYGTDQTRWPIAYFDALGLFNLQHAHLAACQSSRR